MFYGESGKFAKKPSSGGNYKVGDILSNVSSNKMAWLHLLLLMSYVRNSN